ncbi:EthD domain-containing protein [Nocardioides fonticola]|uniref:EthD domain-containing protein n=1 Tax=Nocardioides fonticola TaxID=450363 RepID=A0ABP7XIN9_9ACTN
MTWTTWPPAGTPKYVYLLWGGVADDLIDMGFRTALRDLGALRLQVNTDDADVAGAMRFHTGDAPITAVVSLWGRLDDAGLRGVHELLAERADRVAGWRVDERRRLDPPEHYDGERADALANVAVLRRPDELDRAEWLQRWMVDHTGVAIRTQATLGYVQHLVLEAVTPDAPRVDGIVEELFPTAGVTDVHAFYGSGGDDEELKRRLEALMASVARIGADRDLDLVPSSRRLWDLAPWGADD